MPAAVEMTGPRQSPKPTLATIEGPRTSVVKAASGLIRAEPAEPGRGEEPADDQQGAGSEVVAE
jgi:hypothetical protein